MRSSVNKQISPLVSLETSFSWKYRLSTTATDGVGGPVKCAEAGVSRSAKVAAASCGDELHGKKSIKSTVKFFWGMKDTGLRSSTEDPFPTPDIVLSSCTSKYGCCCYVPNGRGLDYVLLYAYKRDFSSGFQPLSSVKTSMDLGVWTNSTPIA